MVAAEEYRLACRIRSFDNATARHLDFARIELARPDRDPPQIILSDHAPLDRTLNLAISYCIAATPSRAAFGHLRNLPPNCQTQDISKYRFTLLRTIVPARV